MYTELLRTEIRRRIDEAQVQSDTADDGKDRSFVLGKLSALYEMMGFIAGTEHLARR